MSNEMEEKTGQRKELSRRLFLKGVGSSAVAAPVLAGAEALKEVQGAGTKILGPGLIPIALTINGETYKIRAEPRETLLDVMRNRLEITGAKMICDRGSCGGCTVYIDGKTAYSCMILAVQAQGKEIVTIEGLSNGDELHPVQEAFIEADAMQCGFCTPGFVMSMAAVYRDNPSASLEELKEGIAGHICRCGTYSQIFKAAELAQSRLGGK